MITIRCEVIDKDIMYASELMCKYQQEDVKIISPTETLEVRYEKVSEMQSKEVEKTQPSETEQSES